MKSATQVKIDIFYNDYDNVVSFIDAIYKLNDNKEFDIQLPYQDQGNTEDMTEYYKDQLEDEDEKIT